MQLDATTTGWDGRHRGVLLSLLPQRENLIIHSERSFSMWNIKDQRPGEGPTQGKDPADVQKEDLSSRSGPEFRGTSTGQTAVIGPVIEIKGELTGSEDLVIDGTVNGKVDLNEHHLTIGPGGHITANISAKRITIRGEVRGNVTAREMVLIKEKGKVWGDIVTPRISISDGAFFTGSIEMGEHVSESKQKSAIKDRPQPSQVVAEKSLRA
jgi:cytoskeletal protein CcmA (bactofilin family)